MGVGDNPFAAMRNDRIAIAILGWALACGAIRADESLEFGDFSGMDMRGKVPTGSDLGMANLTGANLRGVDFTGLRLSRTELRGADLSWTRNWAAAALVDEIDAREADFRHADLRGASVTGTYFEEADLRHADLRGAWLSGRFHGARFDEAEVEGAVMLGAVGGLDDGLIVDLAKRGALVDAATFTAALRAGMSAEGRSAAGFQLESADLEGVSFAGGSLHSADLRRANLRVANLSDCNVCWAKLDEARLDGASILKARFIGAELRRASLTRALATGADFSGADLAHADLADADLRGADFGDADLRGANLKGARLDGAKWQAAILDGVRGLEAGVERDLRGKAARWRYDLNQEVTAVVVFAAWPAWCIGMFGGMVAINRLWRRPGQGGLARGLAAFQSVALAPLAVVVLFAATGSSTIAQFNGSMGVWGWWVGAFFPALGVLTVAALAFLVVVPMWILRGRREPGQPLPLVLAAASLTGLALLAALPCTLMLAPRA